MSSFLALAFFYRDVVPTVILLLCLLLLWLLFHLRFSLSFFSFFVFVFSSSRFVLRYRNYLMFFLLYWLRNFRFFLLFLLFNFFRLFFYLNLFDLNFFFNFLGLFLNLFFLNFFLHILLLLFLLLLMLLISAMPRLSFMILPLMFFLMLLFLMFIPLRLLFKCFRYITNSSPIFCNLFLLPTHFNKKPPIQYFPIITTSNKINSINSSLENNLKRTFIIIFNFNKIKLTKCFLNIFLYSIVITFD